MIDRYLDLCNKSYKRFFGLDLISNQEDIIQGLNDADFVFASHSFWSLEQIFASETLGAPQEPKFIFGNTKALELWELDLESFIGMPSKYTAESELREDRQRLLQEVNAQGYIENYSGIRISSKGRRFQINNAIVFNVLKSETVVGQAVKFDDYKYI